MSHKPAVAAIAALAGIAIAMTPLHAGVVFSESFEAPVVSGFDDNTVPSGGKWIGSSGAFNAGLRGLYNESVVWPVTPAFTTPYGKQGYSLNYSTTMLTTAQGATGQTITAGVTYTLTFHAAKVAGTTTDYLAHLVAFDVADGNAARENPNSMAGTIVAQATGAITASDMSDIVTIVFTPDASHPHLGKELGIRFDKASGDAIYDNIRLITGHDLNPDPANGEDLDAGGNVTLRWTNVPPNAPATETPVDVWFGSDPGSLGQVVDGLALSSTIVSAPAAGTYYWRIDSYPDGNANGTPVTGDVFLFTIADTDGDGIPDGWEILNFGAPAANDQTNAGLDGDVDGLSNLDEYIRSTNPKVADTDGDSLLDGVESATGTWGSASNTGTLPLVADSDKDGLSDGVETNTGNWVSAANTGTDPNDADWDKDGLKDGAETNTGTYVDRFNTGSNPYLVDTDNDGAGDWYEAVATFTNPSSAAQTSPIPYPLPDPDGASGVTTKPVKVYIMAGQSNTVGIGQVNGTAPGTLETIAKRENKFPNLLNASNNWIPRNDVLYRGVVTATAKGPLAPGQGASNTQVGPELGFGQIMGWYHDEPVLILKASQGNRSLGWDFLPPGSPRQPVSNPIFAAYGETPQTSPTGIQTVFGSWYGGKQYDDCFRSAANTVTSPPTWQDGVAYAKDATVLHKGFYWICTTAHTSAPATEPDTGASWTTRWKMYENAYSVLAKFNTLYPQWAAQGYEIAGFCWWQGHKDQDGTNNPYATLYQDNLVRLINALRADFNAPSAPFVVATIGFGGEPLSAKDADFQQVFNAQMAVQNLPQFAGTVKSVDILKYWRTIEESPRNQDFHYNQNAETYMLVGDAMGRAMLSMQDDTAPPAPSPLTFAIEPTAVNATTVGMVATTAIDVSGPVEYYFENTSNSTTSGWTSSTRWDNTGLAAGSYDYRVKARDSKGNEGAWSATLSASPGSDVTAPTPAPAFAGPLTVLGENSIAMSATPASDINGVEYYFACTAGGGPDSGWQASTEFTALGLAPGTQYTYVVRARDGVGNLTGDSAPESATTTAPDIAAPSPSPMTFASAPSALGTNAITMTATTASDASGVEYFFEAVSGGTSSGWQNSATYTDSSLSPGTEYGYRVRARDKSPAQNATDWSGVFNATTAVPDETPPSPNPMTFASPPAATGSNSIAMTAATATDPNGVEYLFTNVTLGTTSGWQSSPVYTNTGLQPETEYVYQVKARDTSENFNETAPSAVAAATTLAPPTGPGGALIYEPFEDSNSTLTGNAAGTGLTGNWTASNTSFLVAASSYSYGTLPTAHNKVTYSAGNGRASAGIAAGTLGGLLNHGQTLWFGMIVRTPDSGGSNPDTGFGIGTDPIPDSAMQGTIGAGKAAFGWTIKSDKLQASIWNGGTNVRGTNGPAVAKSTTILVVGEIIWGADASASDTIKLYLPDINLNLGTVKASVSAVIDQSAFDTISTGLKVNTGYGFDEIRFGSSYEAAIGMAGGNEASPYATWTAGPFAGTLSDASADLDFDGGGLATGIEWVLGGDPTDGSDDASIAPIIDNTSDPDFFIFSFHRSDEANTDPNTTIAVEYGDNLGGWTKAVAGPDIVITEDDNGATDLVKVKIRRTMAGDRLFVRLNVVVSQP